MYGLQPTPRLAMPFSVGITQQFSDDLDLCTVQPNSQVSSSLSPVYTIQPVVNPVVQPGLNEQRLFVQHGCQTGLTTGWMFVYTIQPVIKPVV